MAQKELSGGRTLIWNEKQKGTKTLIILKGLSIEAVILENEFQEDTPEWIDKELENFVIIDNYK